jgi:hypothetical protein
MRQSLDAVDLFVGVFNKTMSNHFQGLRVIDVLQSYQIIG